jgi:hypothetical protein
MTDTRTPEHVTELGPYDLRAEAQKIIEAIQPTAGATMTLMCALHEAWQAGLERRQPVWRFSDD